MLYRLTRNPEYSMLINLGVHNIDSAQYGSPVQNQLKSIAYSSKYHSIPRDSQTLIGRLHSHPLGVIYRSLRSWPASQDSLSGSGTRTKSDHFDLRACGAVLCPECLFWIET